MNRVFVYRNLRDRCWSIRYKGKVIGHAKELFLHSCEFRVNEKARQKIVDGGRKTVHAGIVGIQESKQLFYMYTFVKNYVKINYNPRYVGHFYNVDDGSPIEAAMYCHLYFEGDKPVVKGYDVGLR